MRLELLLKPQILIIIQFTIQALVWFFCMPSKKIEGLELVANKFYTLDSLVKYLLFLFQIIISFWIFSKIKFTKRKSRLNYKKLANILYYILIIVYIIFAVELISYGLKNIFNLLLNGQLGRILFLKNNFKLKTLFNLSPLIITIYSQYYFKYKEKKVLYKTILLLMIVFIDAYVFAARMFIVYNLFVIIISYVIFNRKKYLNTLLLIIPMFMLSTLIFVAEVFRFGVVYSKKMEIGLWSLETLKKTLHFLVTAYISSDFNNMMVILNQKSSYQIFSTAGSLVNWIPLMFKENITNYSSIVDWESAYGTVNIIGIMWYDFGWFLLIIFPIVTFLITRVYKQIDTEISYYSIIYPLIYIGLLSGIRINFFLQNIFIINIFVLTLFRISVFKGEKNESTCSFRNTIF